VLDGRRQLLIAGDDTICGAEADYPGNWAMIKLSTCKIPALEEQTTPFSVRSLVSRGFIKDDA
jgi:hypothetical protein